MRALATHSRKGEISGLVIFPPDGPPVAGMPGLDQQVTELDVPEEVINLMRDSGDELQILETLKAYRVELGSEARLVMKEGAS